MIMGTRKGATTLTSTWTSGMFTSLSLNKVCGTSTGWSIITSGVSTALSMNCACGTTRKSITASMNCSYGTTTVRQSTFFRSPFALTILQGRAQQFNAFVESWVIGVTGTSKRAGHVCLFGIRKGAGNLLIKTRTGGFFLYKRALSNFAWRHIRWTYLRAPGSSVPLDHSPRPSNSSGLPATCVEGKVQGPLAAFFIQLNF